MPFKVPHRGNFLERAIARANFIRPGNSGRDDDLLTTTQVGLAWWVSQSELVYSAHFPGPGKGMRKQ
jgi:hypothetical protein